MPSASASALHPEVVRRSLSILNQSIVLVRDAGYASERRTLADLLKSKSQDCVRDLLIVWDDPTSRNILGIKTNGLMGTHDEETKHFFKHSSVQVLLCPQSAGKRHSLVKQQVYGARPIRRWLEKKVVNGPDEKKLVYRVEKNGGLVNATTGEGVMIPRQ